MAGSTEQVRFRGQATNVCRRMGSLLEDEQLIETLLDYLV